MKDLFFSSAIIGIFVCIILIFRERHRVVYTGGFFRFLWILLILKMIIPVGLISGYAPVKLIFNDIPPQR